MYKKHSEMHPSRDLSFNTPIWYFTECGQTAAGQIGNALAQTLCFVTWELMMLLRKKSDINQHR